MVSGDGSWPDGPRVRFYYDHAILDKKKGHYWDPDATFYCDKFSIYIWLSISWETMWMDLRVGEVDRWGKISSASAASSSMELA